MPRPLVIGGSDFRKLRRSGAAYVDKTGFVAEALSVPDEVLLFTRPRRFGKTLNLSTLRYFLERSDEDRAPLFDGLALGQHDALFTSHHGRYPVIWLTFKDVKAASFDDCLTTTRNLLRREVNRLSGDLDADSFAELRRALSSEAAAPDTEEALLRLSAALERRHGQGVCIFIDEYDTPIHAAVAGGYYDSAIGFFRNLLSAGLKDNPHLYRGFLTGILRVAKESLFSGLNNLLVYTATAQRFATGFGFTDDEVGELAAEQELAAELDNLRTWYDGYRFGGVTIYNPWSVVNYLRHPGEGFKPYWEDTSDNSLLRELLLDRAVSGYQELEELLAGRAVEATIADTVVLRDLARQPGALWTFLLHLGYLRGERVEGAEPGASSDRFRLQIPNREVRRTYETVFRGWLEAGLGGGAQARRLASALLAGDAAEVERLLGTLVATVLSYHDPAGSRPERVCHAFLLGLLVTLEPDYEVRSNRKSGYGRVDIVIRPRTGTGPGVIVELKTADHDEMDAQLDAALAQIRERRYAVELATGGADPIHLVAAVFAGKRVAVRAAAHAPT